MIEWLPKEMQFEGKFLFENDHSDKVFKMLENFDKTKIPIIDYFSGKRLHSYAFY